MATTGDAGALPPLADDTVVAFLTVDTLGAEVALRMPEPGELTCPDCLDAADRLAALDDVEAALAAQLEGLGELGVLDQLDSGTADPVDALLRPASGMPGHDCTAGFLAPVWIVRQPECATLVEATAVVDCRCGVVDLYEALEHLSAHDRQAAVAAHLHATNRLYDHLIAAENLLEGVPANEAADPSCVACVALPGEHIAELEAELTNRSLQLATVLRAYDVTLAVGPRRPAGPIGPARR